LSSGVFFDGWMSLAACYALGKGRERDFSTALEYYEKAAENGSALANDYLGYLYLEGDLVPADAEKGLAYYRRAAELGNARSMMALGYAYQTGTLCPPDPEEAARWYEAAAAAGREDAAEALFRLQGK
jgi:TPR repeat protein